MSVMRQRAAAAPQPAPPAAIPFAPPALGPDEIGEVIATLESGWLSTGPRVRRFEEAFARYVGAPHAVAVNSCTAALHLALLASKIGAGDEVITTPLTFCATANVVVHTGATPVFADIDPRTWNIATEAVQHAITDRTRAVVPVHYAGRPADVAALTFLSRRRGLALIADAAHCVEGVADGRRIGAATPLTCFSFYATKNLTTGEGGMVTAWDDKAADFMRVASLHGMSRDAWARYVPGSIAQYDVVMPGFKYNMMDIQAAIGLHQLARIEALWSGRPRRSRAPCMRSTSTPCSWTRRARASRATSCARASAHAVCPRASTSARCTSSRTTGSGTASGAACVPPRSGSRIRRSPCRCRPA
jgi:dTDP-4-amino-4,6-dideoxygalactose transaminase